MTKWQWLVIGFCCGVLVHLFAFMATVVGRGRGEFNPTSVTIWGLIGAVCSFIGYFLWNL